MLKCDESCTCPLKEACLGRRHPEWAVVMRGHWESGDPVRREHVVMRSSLDWRPPPEPVPPVILPDGRVEEAPPPLPQPNPMPVPVLPTIPLAGDLVAAATARIGADRLAKWLSSKLGRDCGCAGRQAKLNEIDMKLRKWIGKEKT